MESRAYALFAGLFVIVFVAGLIGAIVWFTGTSGARVNYVVVSDVPVSGLTLQAPVRLRGVDVGSVESIWFDRQDPRRILVTVSVNEAAPVTEGTYARLAYWGVSGMTFVQLQNDSPSIRRLPPLGRITMRPSTIDVAAASGQQLLANAADAAGRVEKLLSDQNLAQLTRTLKKLEQAAAGLGQATQSIQSNITETTLPKINDLTDDLSHQARKLDRLLTELNQQPQSLLFGKQPPPPGPGEPGFANRRGR
jgi:phospholipid/cholesterol/gamma-HCH transport system substrate-binding protein